MRNVQPSTRKFVQPLPKLLLLLERMPGKRLAQPQTPLQELRGPTSAAFPHSQERHHVPRGRRQTSHNWVPCERMRDPDDGVSYDPASLRPLLGPDKPSIRFSHIDHNPIRDRQLGIGIALWAPKKAGYSIELRFRDTFLIDGSPPNRSILASAGMYDTVSHNWCGSVVAMRSTWSEFYEDITLSDFRHALDYFLSYGTTDTEKTGGDVSQDLLPPTAIRGVMISCYGERVLHGSDRFVAVQVSAHHPTRTVGKYGSISPIYQRLGIPLRLWKDPDIETWIDPPGWNRSICAESNQDAAFLMMEIDPMSSGWGFAPIYWNTELGNVLVIREDQNNLAVEDLSVICRFAQKRLVSMMEAGFGNVKRTKKEVLEFMTAKNLEKFKNEIGGVGDESDEEFGRL
jgi:hypothetical protein